MGSLHRLQEWFAERCDGEWEHQQSVQIGTLDDPGWFVRIGLRGTPLESRDFAELERLRPEADWVHCRVRNGCFEGYGGPRMLDEILTIFFEWAGIDDVPSSLMASASAAGRERDLPLM